LRREVLKELGVSTVPELVSQTDGIRAYCTTDWLTLRQSNGEQNVSRRKIRRKWQKIQSTCFKEVNSSIVRTKVLQENLSQLMN
jgi:hypothetical protein